MIHPERRSRPAPQIHDALVRTLQDHEHELIEAQELAHVGTWAWDIVSGEVTWSEELYRIFGMRPEEFTPTYDTTLLRIRASHRDRSRGAVEAALVDGASRVYECPIILPSGAERWIRVSCAVGAEAVWPPVRMHGTTQDITDFRVTAADSMATESTLHDPLTGLATWDLFANRTEAALARATRDGSSTALLIIDIDQLHVVNDDFGHQTGDLVLVEVARRIEGAFRPYDTIGRLPDTIARLGGDEFLVLCEQIGDSALLGLCRRVADVLETPVELGVGEVSISAAVTSTPSTRTLPPVASNSRGIRLIRVVLPLPVPPMMAVIWPGSASRLMPHSTGCCAPG